MLIVWDKERPQDPLKMHIIRYLTEKMVACPECCASPIEFVGLSLCLECGVVW